MPKRWLVVLEVTTYTRIHGQQQLGEFWYVAGNQPMRLNFVVKLYSRKIFSYIFCVQKRFYNKKSELQ